MAKLMKNLTVINDGYMSGNLDSGIIELSEVDGIAVHSVYTGTPSGTIRILGSNDGVNFVELDANVIAASGQDLVNLSLLMCAFVKVTYTVAAGSGSLTTNVSMKG